MTSAPGPLPALGYQATPAGAGGAWSAETKAIVAAGAVVSLLALLTWGGSLWMYLRPADFSGRLILQPWPSVDFALFVLRAALHAAVIAGALAAVASQRVARRILLPAALCVVALGLYQFASFSVFQTGLTRRREGADQVVWLAMDGARLVGTYLVHGLMAVALARPSARAASGPAVSDTIVIAAAVDSVVRLADRGALVWISLQPALFKSIGSAPWTPHAAGVMAAAVLLHLALISGAAAALLSRGRHAGRRLLLLGAAGLLALNVYGFVRPFVTAPPPGMPRYQGPQAITNTVNAVGRVLTGEMIHVLVILAMARRRPRAPIPAWE